MRLWSFIFVLVLATALGVLIRQDPGYAFFSYGQWTVEMPLWLLAILMILAVSIIVFILWFLNSVFTSGERIKLWWKRHTERSARQQTYRGMLELVEGRWQQAERYLIQAASHNETPLLNYLCAAKAAEEAGSAERRDRYLQKAFAINSDSDIAVKLTQAELQLRHGELEQSFKNIKNLYQQAPKHPTVLRLLSSVYEKLNDWQALLTLLPILKKYQVFSKKDITALEQKIYLHILPLYAEKSAQDLIALWKDMPRPLQSDPQMIYLYAKLLIQQSALDAAESVLRNALKRAFNNDLIYLYGLLSRLENSRQNKKQLAFAESFLPVHFNNPYLLLTLGRLCLQNQLWGKARGFFEQSLSIKPLTETYAELGQLMGQLGQTEKEEEYFKKGLLSATKLHQSSLQPPKPSIDSQNPSQFYLSYDNTPLE
jgi:HemY protein